MKHRCAAVILMAGEGRRFGSSLPKQFHPLNNQKIYLHTLQVFLDSKLFDQIILVTHPDWIDTVKSEIPPGIHVTSGGPTRQASSLQGLHACDPATNYVMIHDAVRPFVTREILQKNLEAAYLHSAVDTCISSADTIVHSLTGQFISTIPPRREYLRGQTPQTFEYQLIFRAHQQTQRQEATDDCSLVHELDHPIAIVAGDESNIKITTELDVQIAELILSKIGV